MVVVQSPPLLVYVVDLKNFGTVEMYSMVESLLLGEQQKVVDAQENSEPAFGPVLEVDEWEAAREADGQGHLLVFESRMLVVVLGRR